jgi:hypothetical protein
MKGLGYLQGVSFAFAFRLLSPTARERGAEPTIIIYRHKAGQRAATSAQDPLKPPSIEYQIQCAKKSERISEREEDPES